MSEPEGQTARDAELELQDEGIPDLEDGSPEAAWAEDPEFMPIPRDDPGASTDFGTTAFLYGMSVGFSYGLSLQDQTSGSVFAPVVIGALSYTIGAVVFLSAANPDRGDLPLALAITSYLPGRAPFHVNR